MGIYNGRNIIADSRVCIALTHYICRRRKIETLEKQIKKAKGGNDGELGV